MEISLEYVFNFIEENKAVMTWQEIADALNKEYGLNYTESKYRKPYQAFAKGVEYSNKLSGLDDQLERIAGARSRLKLDRAIATRERYIINQTLTKIATYSLFNEEVNDNIKKGYPKITPIKLKESRDDFYIVNIGDLHYKGYENLGSIFNEMYSNIMQKQSEIGFKELIISELGDTVEGATLRTSQLLAIKKGLIDQTLDVARYYSEFLTELSKTMKIKFVCVEESNHTQLRNLGTGRNELPAEDTMKVLVEFIKSRTEKNPNIEVISAGDVNFEYNGFNFAFTHGHKINKKDYVAAYSKHHNMDVDYMFSGHLHHKEELVLGSGGYYNKKHIKCPKACLETSDYEEGLLVGSMPGILFNKFTKNTGHVYAEELFLGKQLEKEKKKVLK